MSEHVYAYGIIEDEDLEMEIDGVEDANEIYNVSYRNFSAIVSDIDTTDPERSDENVERHNQVLQEVLESDGGKTVVPMGFGMAFKNKKTLKGVIRGARRALRKALNDIDGKVELGLKIVSPAESAPSETEVEDYVEERLDDLVVNDKENDKFTDRLLLNRSYLVERDERSELDSAVDDIEEEFEDCIVQYTGPWPPYNFVDIHIGAKGEAGG
ncbi:MAG: GvpL/GvpF family gas vesicle protein [Halobacteria archaeon]